MTRYVESAALPAWLRGSWRREWICRDGAQSSDLSVHYLQADTAFIDLRLPAARPTFDARSFADASDEQLLLLAAQKGFAGYASLRGEVLTWTHAIDFQPEPAGEVDAGRVEPTDGGMLEYGLDGSYHELWSRSTREDQLTWAAELRVKGRLAELWVVTGDEFMYARARSQPLPAASSLAELVSSALDGGAAGRDLAIAYLDCELAHGHGHAGAKPWVIQLSTLPWREGSQLVPPLRVVGEALRVADGWRLLGAAPTAEQWRSLVGAYGP